MLAENVKKAYALIMGQCSPTLVSKIKGSDKYTDAANESNVVKPQTTHHHQRILL